MPIRVRVGAIVVHAGFILLVNHRRLGRSYWVLPGGALEAGESLAAGAEREVREETGVEVHMDRLLYLVESFPSDGARHNLDVVFHTHLRDAKAAHLSPAKWVIEQPEFVPLERLAGLVFLPPIATELAADAAAGFPGPTRYLVNRWVDLAGQPIGRGGEGVAQGLDAGLTDCR